jgi:DME family drug/metabolite transporter
MDAVPGELFALLAALAFALATVLSRRFMVGPDPVAPEAGVLVSIVTNVAAFGLLAAVELWRGAAAALTPHSLAYFVLGGLCGTVAGRNLSYQSVLRMGPSRSTAIRLSNTLFAALIGLAVLRELPRAGQLAGATLITVGLWLVVRERDGAGAKPDLRGVLLALGGAVGFALGDTFRRAGLQVTPAPFLGAGIGASTALAVQAAWLATRRPRLGRTSRPWRLDVLGSALANTAAILLLFLGLQRSPVANVAVLYNLQVLLVILLSRWVLRGDERVGERLVAGSVVCLLGTAAVLFG